MRTANYVISTVSIVLGIGLVLFVMSQADSYSVRTAVWPLDWSIGTTIGVVLILNGAIRLWFAQDDAEDESHDETPYTS